MIVQFVRTAGKHITMQLLLVLLCVGVVAPVNANAATDAELKDQIAELIRILNILKAEVASEKTSAGGDVAIQQTDLFTEPVVFDAENNSIRLLQEILKTDPAIYPEGLVSGYFGTLTKKSIAAFQAKVGLPVTGTFTEEMEYVLNYTLRAIPLKSYPLTYLVSDKVSATVQASVKDLAIRDVIDNGVVVLRANPVFSETIPTTDTATIQRILITERMNRAPKVNGLMDAVTIQAVAEFLRKYGVPYTIPADGIIQAESLMTDDAVSLFRKILEINAAPTIAHNLLTLATVQPEILIPNNTRTITELKALRDYRANNTQVKVTYDGGYSESFVITVVSPNKSVATEIATKLNRPVAQINSVIKHDSVYGDDFKKIKLSVYTSYGMVLDITYKNGKSESQGISEVDIESFVTYYYGGDRLAYQKDFDYYVEQARKGEPIEKVYQLVADTLRTTKAKVRDILVIDVERYSNDPCASMYCNPGGA